MSLERALEEFFEQIIDRKVREQVAAMPTPRPAKIDAATQGQIAIYEVISHKPYLTKSEAAVYLDCSERSIEEWSARPVDRNPFPVSRIGRDLRLKREQLDQWAEREGQRFRLKEAV